MQISYVQNMHIMCIWHIHIYIYNINRISNLPISNLSCRLSLWGGVWFDELVMPKNAWNSHNGTNSNEKTMIVNINDYRWIFVKIYEYQWLSMNINDYEYLWVSMNINGYQWTSLKINDCQWRSMSVNEYQWISMQIIAYELI